jgi:hypothetical protein
MWRVADLPHQQHALEFGARRSDAQLGGTDHRTGYKRRAVTRRFRCARGFAVVIAAASVVALLRFAGFVVALPAHVADALIVAKVLTRDRRIQMPSQPSP